MLSNKLRKCNDINANGTAWLWALAAFLVASPRLFEQGISLDPALYGVVARHFANDGKWWSLRFGETLFPQFMEQPFLVFWVQGFIFKLLGSSDFSTRILGLICGSGTFYFLFRIAHLLAGRYLASVFAFLCLIDLNFIGRFATLYLEVPLLFFGFGALYFFYEWIETKRLWPSLLAGIMLAGACLTKGFAALPILGTIGLLAACEIRWKIFKPSGFWLLFFVATLIVSAFCLLQVRYGEYPFATLYYENAFVTRTLNVGLGVGPLPFLKKLLVLGGPGILLSLLSLWSVCHGPRYRRVFRLGLVGAAIFIVANAVLGFANLHYYYGIFPFLNLMGSIAVVSWLSRWRDVNWLKIAFVIALAGHVFWNLAPIPMRRKSPQDFYRLQGVMTRLHQASPGHLEGVGISDSDWIYRQFSYWYWNVDTVLLPSVSNVRARVVVSALEKGNELERVGYTLCRGTPLYDIWVKGSDLVQICRRQFFNVGLID